MRIRPSILLVLLLCGGCHTEYPRITESHNGPTDQATQIATQKALDQYFETLHRLQLRMIYEEKMRNTRVTKPSYLLPGEH